MTNKNEKILAMDNVNERIMLIIRHFGMNKNSFSKKVKLSGSAVLENIVAGRRSKPSFDVLEKILLAFDSIDANWLVTGNGDMLKKNQAKEYVFDSNPLDIIEEKVHVAKKTPNCTNCEAMSTTIQMLNKQIETLNKLVESQNQTIELLQNKNETGKQARSA